jgi:hypothetical protein
MAAFDDDTPLTDEELALAARGADLVAAALADPQASAPASLREAIERERAQAAAAPARGFGRARGRLIAVLGGGVAAVVVALVIALGGSGGGTGGPTAVQVAAVGRLPATASAPAVVPATDTAPARLDADVEGLAFPDWTAAFKWAASGRRTDEVGGRAVTTVFYRNPKGATLGYSIVAGDPIGGAPDGQDVAVGDDTYRLAHGAGRTTVTWTQDGHTCVIDAPATVPDAKLVELASWANV